MYEQNKISQNLRTKISKLPGPGDVKEVGADKLESFSFGPVTYMDTGQAILRHQE